MNKTSKNVQPNMAGMGGLPLIILLGVILGAGYLLMGDGNFSLFKERKNVEVRRLESYPLEVGVNEDMERKHIVMTSEEELINFLSSIDKSNALTVDEKINFDREYLLGVTSKTLDTDGHEFKIKKVYIDKEKDELLVSSKLRKPSDDCVSTKGLNMIVDIVAISKTDKEVKFETLIETFSCSDE